MTIKHILGLQGWLTEALYEHEGKPMCARFGGVLNDGQVQSLLGFYRRRAA